MFIKRLRQTSNQSNNETINGSTGRMSAPASRSSSIPYLAISMQLESSAREIHDTFEHLDNTDLSVVETELQESTSVALHFCKRKVLRPYFRLLALLGWRPIFYPIAPEVTWYAKLFNVIYTALVIFLMLVGYVLQFASCFRQDGYPPYRNITNNQLIIDSNRRTTSSFVNTWYPENNSSEPKLKNTEIDWNKQFEAKSSTQYECSGNFVSLYLIPDLLHFFSYLFVFHLMRTPECECLQNLLERVFLQTSRASGWVIAQKKLVQTLRTFLWLCVTWILVSVLGHTVHIMIFQEICFTWMQPNNEVIVKLMTAFTILSLTWNDIVCAAIITSYSVHCQLNISYIGNLVSGVREKRIDFKVMLFARHSILRIVNLKEFAKRVGESRKFINYLNSEQALGVSLLIANFGCRAVVAIFGLLSQQIVVTNDIKIAIMILISSLLWLSLLSVAVIQAVRLTNSCEDLRDIGHELRSRPFGYQDTPQEDLDSLLLFTSNTRLKAKMLNIPIRGSAVVSILVILMLVILFLGQINFVKF